MVHYGMFLVNNDHNLHVNNIEDMYNHINKHLPAGKHVLPFFYNHKHEHLIVSYNKNKE
jgi:hypothetical protein